MAGCLITAVFVVLLLGYLAVDLSSLVRPAPSEAIEVARVELTRALDGKSPGTRIGETTTSRRQGSCAVVQFFPTDYRGPIKPIVKLRYADGAWRLVQFATDESYFDVDGPNWDSC